MNGHLHIGDIRLTKLKRINCEWYWFTPPSQYHCVFNTRFMQKPCKEHLCPTKENSKVLLWPQQPPILNFGFLSLATDEDSNDLDFLFEIIGFVNIFWRMQVFLGWFTRTPFGFVVVSLTAEPALTQFDWMDLKDEEMI